MMEKPAVTDSPIHDLIRRRWSPRALSKQPVEPEKVRTLLEAARWAPSCYNFQPWAFLIATRDNPEEFERMFDCLVDQNKVWAESAWVLMIAIARINSWTEGKENPYAVHDVGLAIENLLLQAIDLGLYAHPMAGFKKKKTRQEYNIPDDCNPMTAVAVGYPGDPQDLPEDLREMELGPRSRRPLEEYIFTGEWGKTAPIIQNKE